MKFEEYKEKIAEVLQTPLNVESPDQLFKDVAVIESLAYLATKYSASYEQKKTELNETIRRKKEEMIVNLTGTQLEKNIKIEAGLANELKELEQVELRMKYWRSIGKLIENKISLAQSVLANITSQIKSNMYYENIK